MNTKLTKGLLGLGAMLLASQVNAATISVTPATNNVVVGDTFALTVSGDFTAEGGTNGGGVILSWNDTQVQLTDSIANVRTAIEADLVANNWILPNAGNLTVTSNSVSVDVLNFFGSLPTFDIFSLDLVAVPPPSSGPINITASALSDLTQGWEGLPVVYNGATITTSAVPVPAAAWLFGSGLIGLVGIARRKTQLA
jgi:hypothetical protein